MFYQIFQHRIILIYHSLKFWQRLVHFRVIILITVSLACRKTTNNSLYIVTEKYSHGLHRTTPCTCSKTNTGICYFRCKGFLPEGLLKADLCHNHKFALPVVLTKTSLKSSRFFLKVLEIWAFSFSKKSMCMKC